MPQLTVHILLATYNGGRFLAEQLSSIARQTHANWILTVSDDGSTDNTLDIVAQFAEQVSQQVTVLSGPCQGSSTRNFFHLIQHAQVKDLSDLFAFCDQDDVWLEDKLERAVAWHANNIDKPVRLYCGRTRFVNEQLKPIGLSPGIKRPPSFGNALVQNIASGNTMVMSSAVLMAQKEIQPEHSVWHDWTTYMVATSLGGFVWFDTAPSLLYRQHSANVIGSNNGLKAQLLRLGPLFSGRFRKWSDMNQGAAESLMPMLPVDSIYCLRDFQIMRSLPNAFQRVLLFLKSEIRRQSALSNFIIAFALIFRLV